MDLKFFQLLERFSHDSTQTTPRDQETLALTFMRRAYELGKEAGREEQRAEDLNSRFERYPVWRRADGENGGDSEPGM